MEKIEVRISTRDRDNLKWAILAVTTLGAFIANVDATIVVVALPRMLGELHSSINTGLWVLNGYLLVSTVLFLPVGRWSDLFGRKQIYISGFFIFALGSALCAISPSGGWLVGFRLLQGIGGGILGSIMTPIITEAFPPEELGRGLGINSVAWVLGSVVGPVIGGILVTAFGWRSIFWVTVPFALAGAIAGMIVLSAGKRPEKRQPMDWVGALTFTTALATLLIGLSEGIIWGWASGKTVTLFVIAGTALIGFIVGESRRKYPLFMLKLFKHHHFTAIQVTVVFARIAFYATTFLLTFYLQGGLHQTPLATGLLLLPLSIPQIATAPLGGRLADRIGFAKPIVFGLVLLGISDAVLSFLGPHLNYALIIVPLSLMSVGNGFFWPSLVKGNMQSAPKQVAGAAAGMFYSLRNVGFTLSLTIALLSVETSLPHSIATKFFLGLQRTVSGSSVALSHSIDIAFRLFVLCYIVAIAAASLLLRRVRPAEEAAPQQALAIEA